MKVKTAATYWDHPLLRSCLKKVFKKYNLPFRREKGKNNNSSNIYIINDIVDDINMNLQKNNKYKPVNSNHGIASNFKNAEKNKSNRKSGVGRKNLNHKNNKKSALAESILLEHKNQVENDKISLKSSTVIDKRIWNSDDIRNDHSSIKKVC